MRRKLKDLGIKKLDVVFSTELPYKRPEAEITAAEDLNAAANESLSTPEKLEVSTIPGAATDSELQSADTPAAGSTAGHSSGRKDTPASMIFVPACAGLMMAGYACRKLAGI